ncbi:MAG: septum formation initiator family protein [Bacteroidota bacterium]
MKLLTYIPALLKNKYFICSLAFIAWVTFFDSKDLLTQAQRRKELSDLQASKEHFTKLIDAERKELSQLQSNPATLEKYAREKYHMKRDNEDLFLIPSEAAKPEN